MKIRIIDLLKTTTYNINVSVNGWVRTHRQSKNISFIAINDGSTVHNLQIVAEHEKIKKDFLKLVTTGSAIRVDGMFVLSAGNQQHGEIIAQNIVLYGTADPQEYPLQKKGHSLDFLRNIAHLRMRTNIFGAIFRVRHNLAFAVSGQLEGELGALGLGAIYTFGPTFRAENSNTYRHLAEFWMVEPEMAFIDINDNMDLAEDFLKYVIRHAIEACESDLIFLNNTVNSGLIERLHSVVNNKFVRLPYSQAIEILKQSNREFEIPIVQGMDLSSEHERFLVEEYFCCPIIVTDYPKEIKAFYMKLNEDGKTVRAMDILFPQIGEIIGGSERESDYLKLRQRMEELGMNVKQLWWYLETRKFGTVPHAGFGLGFERLVLFVTGMSNIRDVIPFPRTPKNANF